MWPSDPTRSFLPFPVHPPTASPQTEAAAALSGFPGFLASLALGSGQPAAGTRVLLVESRDVLPGEEVLHQRRDAAQALQDGVHVARVAQVPQARHALAVRLVPAGPGHRGGGAVVCTLGAGAARKERSVLREEKTHPKTLYAPMHDPWTQTWGW